ncbi:unnamed protein product [Paramecium octaurelia]|uniref:Transmembrane protein n=1 Tax=Paramecium octaurelia TaxID=43137 RepID=A0A8S1VYU0_PAROT|nr:unnamed protein product [Paramecium octaurelia]
MIRLISSNHHFVVLVLFSLLISSCNTSNHLREHIQQHQNKHLQQRQQTQDPYAYQIFGVLIIFVATILLWYNERRQAITEYRLNEAKRQCTSVSSLEANPNLNNQLIHTSGRTTTNDLVVDAAFGVSLKDCITLNRVVEMYQWVRKTKEENNSTVYYYVKEWSAIFHSDCDEEHSNNKNYWIVESETQFNKNVRLGAYLMSYSLALQITEERIHMHIRNALNTANFYGFKKGFICYENSELYIYFQQQKGVQTLNDLRVSFFARKTGPTTVITYLQNDEFTPFVFQDRYNQTVARDQNFLNQDHSQFKCTDCCCYCCNSFRSAEIPLTDINWIYQSILTLDEVFQQKVDQNQFTTTSLRLGGYIIMGVGFGVIIFPVAGLLQAFPLMGNFLAQITGYIFLIVSLIISIPFTLLVIAFAWLFHHPKYGFALIGLSALITTGIYLYIKYLS